MPGCKSQNTKRSELRFYVVPGQSNGEVHVERVIG